MRFIFRLILSLIALNTLVISSSPAGSNPSPAPSLNPTAPPSPSPSPVAEHAKGTLEKIEKGKITFAGYEPIQTSWEHIEFQGLIAAPTGSTFPPYAIFVAKPCHDCLEETSIQMLRLDGNKLLRFALPGKIHDPKTGETLVDTRSFFGECIPGENSILVSYQKDLIERKRWKKRRKSIEPSFQVTEPQADGTVREKLTELRSMGQLAAKERQTLIAVKQRKCFEVPPKDRRITAKMIRLRPDQDADDAEDEDENPPEKAGTKALPGAPDTPVEPNAADLGIPTLSAQGPGFGPALPKPSASPLPSNLPSKTQ